MTTTLVAPTLAPVQPDPEPCPPACAHLLESIRQHASGCSHYRSPHGKAWCATCRRRVQIEDVAPESQYRREGEVAWRVEYLACGHDNATELGVVGPAPGAPYAGITAAPSVRQRRLGDCISPDPWLTDQHIA